jgi:hypothetical protein
VDFSTSTGGAEDHALFKFFSSATTPVMEENACQGPGVAGPDSNRLPHSRSAQR